MEQITAETDTGWTQKFTAIGYYWLREHGEDIADASVIEYQGGGRAYLVGADDNFYDEWTSGRYEFLGPFIASDTEQLIRLRESAERLLEAARFSLTTPGMIRGRDQLANSVEALSVELAQRQQS